MLMERKMLDTILQMKHITQTFPGVIALDDVDFELKKGEVHALLGENGAGKSTLMKVLTGVNIPDDGEIILFDKKYSHLSIPQAKKLGVSMIYQELNLIPHLSVAENIFLGKEPKKNGFIDRKKMNEEAAKLIGTLGLNLDIFSKINDLTMAYKQIVEIAKALSEKASILIMDEPTAPLTNEEVDVLFKTIKILNKEGVSIIYISHRLNEIFKVCDRATVFRDGKFIKTMEVSETNEEELIKIMVGRSIANQYPPRLDVPQDSALVLDVKNISTEKLENVSINLKKGEILGIGGLVGSGRTELLRAIFGCDKFEGDIYKNGQKICIKSPKHAIDNKIVLATEDRAGQGLLLKLSVKDNIVFPMLNKLKKHGLLDAKKISNCAKQYIEKLKIRTPSEKQIIRFLSGGNQQKVVISKWMLVDADIIMFDEPTRGIDVGAKYEIHLLMNELKAMGKSIIMVSSDMPELIGMSDRIIIMCEGKVTEELNDSKEFCQEKILKSASSG